MTDTNVLFEHHCEPLSIVQIADGISACIDNAINIFADACILKQAGRLPRALSLLIVAGQEAGKVRVLQKMADLDPNDDKSWKKLWKDFRNHSAKNLAGYSFKVSQDYATQPGSGFWELLEYKSKRSKAQEQVRQLALYVDYVRRDNAWLSPSEVTAEIVDLVESDTVKILYHLARQRQIGLLTVQALDIHREEFSKWAPDIEINTEYEIEEFGIRLFGLRGPYKRYWRRLVEEGVVQMPEEEIRLLGKTLHEFLAAEE